LDARIDTGSTTFVDLGALGETLNGMPDVEVDVDVVAVVAVPVLSSWVKL